MKEVLLLAVSKVKMFLQRRPNSGLQLSTQIKDDIEINDSTPKLKNEDWISESKLRLAMAKGR